MTAFYINRRNIILISVCFIICVTATFAWSSNEQTKVQSDNEMINKLTNLAVSKKECDQAALNDVSGMLEKLRFSEDQSEIYNKWDAYLKNSTHFDNYEYLSTIMKFGVDFAGSVKRLNECILIEEKKEKQYSAAWLHDLQKKFGRGYILQNKKSIGFMILGILSYHQSGGCMEARKDAIYKEAPYIFVLHRYIKFYLEFVETLGKSEQEKMKDKTEYAKSIQEIPVDPLKELLAHEAVVYALQINGIINSKKYDPELKDFLMKQPSFAKSFDIGKALKDLREYK